MKQYGYIYRVEQHFISEARSQGRTYNVRDGGLGSLFNGNGPMHGKRHSTAVRAKMSACRTGEKNHNYGKDFSGANNPMFGRKQSQETRDKIATKALGKSKNKGIKRTPEQIEAMRQRALEQKPWLNHVGKKRSAETCKKISDAAKRRYQKAGGEL